MSQSAIDLRMLERIRALLAKAESTTFPAEAEALMAKAQELMTRHSIERALVSASATDASAKDVPGAWRIGIDDPYASAKGLLLARIASANRCEAVSTERFGFATILGFETDLHHVELLYTSLLVQATSMMATVGKTGSPHERSRGFRQSFLVSFAARIGERLEEAAAAAVAAAAAEAGKSLLPVLVERDREVGSACARLFPNTVTRYSYARDGAGWAAGRAAADLAKIDNRAALRSA